MSEIQQKILFVTGKGGVGKSLVAAAVAQNEAKKGRRVLLVEIGEESYYKDFWALPHVGHEPISTKMGFDLALWSGESCLREYVLFYLKLESLYKIFFENRVMRALINVAPGLSEIAILGKVTSGERKVGPPLSYDLIVVDGYASGHMMALLQAPKGLQQAIKFGPMGHHSRQIEEVLENPKLTAFWLVSLLEELPVTETLELQQLLLSSFGIKAHLVANKRLNVPVSAAALKTLASSSEFAGYLEAVADRQKHFMATLAAADNEMQAVPLVFSTDPQTLVDATAEAL